MKKFGIVSSFDEFCGNATYAEVLANGLQSKCEEDDEIIKLSLNQEILRKVVFSYEAKKHINDLCKEASKCEGINIHFEFGLYGPNVKFQTWAIKKLIRSSKKCVITIHRLENPSKFPSFSLKYLLKPLDYINQLKIYYATSPYWRAFISIIKLAKRHGADFVSHHNLCTKRMIGRPYHIRKENIITYPITFFNKKEQDLFYKLQEKDIEHPPVMLPQKKIIRIGLSGFISENKGHECAIRSLSYLPTYYNLFILGSRHPYDFNADYGLKLFKLVDELDLSDRVHFCGRSNTDNEFYTRIKFCDVMVFPYQETGLVGSGNMAIARDLRKLLVISSIEAFEENSKFYTHDHVKYFDPCSPMECAHAIATIENSNQDPRNDINIDTLSSNIYAKLVK